MVNFIRIIIYQIEMEKEMEKEMEVLIKEGV